MYVCLYICSSLQVLSISPVRGVVPPEGSAMCRITFMASGVPSFYDLDLICEVRNSFFSPIMLYFGEISISGMLNT